MPRSEQFEDAYAVIRVDLFQMRDKLPDDPNVYVSVKEIFWTLDEAEAEVERLNRLNADKDSRYAWQYARIRRREGDA
jgi:hypothetical protein